MPKGWFGERRRHSEAAKRGWRRRIKRRGKRATQTLRKNAFSTASNILILTPIAFDFYYGKRAPRLTKEEAEQLKKKIGVKGGVRFLPISELNKTIVGKIITGGGGGVIRVHNLHIPEYSIYSDMEAPTLAHELGHAYVLEHERLGKIFRNKHFRLYRGLLELFPFPLILLKGKKRQAAIIATMTPAIVEEGLASYYGYKGLKKLKKNVSAGEKISLAIPPVARLGIAMGLEDIGRNLEKMKK